MKKKLLFMFLILIMMFLPVCVRAENRIYFDADSANIAPGSTKKFNIIVDSDNDFTKVNFNLITTSAYVGFSSVEFSDQFVRNSSSTTGSNYEIESSTPQKSGTVIGSVTLVAKDASVIGAEGYIRLTKPSITAGSLINLQTAQLKITISNELSDNTYLSGLESSLANINFDKEVLEYTVTVDNEVEVFDLKATAEDPSSTVAISDQTLSKNKNTITVTVKSEKGNTRVYKVIVNKKKEVKTTKAKKENTEKEENSKSDKSTKTGWYAVLLVLSITLALDVIYIKKKH